MDFDIELFKKLTSKEQNKIFKQLYKLGRENEDNKSDYHAGKNVVDVKFIGKIRTKSQPSDFWYFDPI